MLPCLALGVVVLAAATAVPPSHTLTATMANRIDDLGRRIIAQHRTPGLSVAVVEDGRIVYAHGFGEADISTHRRVTPGTEFYIGSISKQFTAAAVLLLEQEGKLKLDDKVAKYVPELTVAGNATILQLLQQTAGLPEYTHAPGLKLDLTHTVKLADIIAAVNKMPPASAPGAKFAYNNFNYMIAGLIVERASGVPLSDYLEQHIFIPLVMNNTFYAGDRGISRSHAIGYTGSPGHFRRAVPWDPAWLFGAGGVVSNVYDLAKWDIGLPLLLRVDAERQMFEPSGAPGALQYGLGWVVDQRGGKRYVWHNGEIAGYLSMNAILPDDNVAVVVLENTDNFHSPAVAAPEAISAQIMDIIVPPVAMHVDNSVFERALEWLQRLSDRRIDRTQLTRGFSSFLTDDLVARENFAALGKPRALIPIESMTLPNGDTTYEFLVRYPRDSYYYKFTLSKDGKVDGLYLSRDR